MTFYIYTLKNPNTGKVVYVGCTCHFKVRMAQHRLRFQRDFGYTPTYEIIEAYKSELYAKIREFECIRKFYKINPLLRQVTSRIRIGGLVKNKTA